MKFRLTFFLVLSYLVLNGDCLECAGTKDKPPQPTWKVPQLRTPYEICKFAKQNVIDRSEKYDVKNSAKTHDMVLVESKNEWKFIPSTIFEHFTSLEYLQMTDVKLETFEKEDFVGAKNFKILVAKQNRLKMLGRKVFEHAENLEHVDLSINQLQFIHETSFHNVKNLLTMELSGNKLMMIHANTFKNFPKLELTLTSNLCYSERKLIHGNNSANYLYKETNCHSYYMQALEQNLEKGQSSSLNWAIVFALFSCCFTTIGLFVIYGLVGK